VADRADGGSRVARWVAVVELAARRVRGRLTGEASRRVVLTALGVVVAVGVQTTVVGVAVGLASGSVVQSEGVDYWVAPDQASLDAVAVSVDDPALGDVHATTARLARDERVQSATPVLVRVVPVRVADPGSGGSADGGEATGGRGGDGDDRVHVLAVGVIPSGDNRTVAGLPTGPLTAGDPFYANGSYDGRWTGQAVASRGALRLLGAERGDALTVVRPGTGSDAAAASVSASADGRNRSVTNASVTGGGDRTLRVTAVGDGAVRTGAGEVPVVLVHLSELQALSGATAGDQADQLLVRTSDPSVRTTLAELYPETTVVARSGLGAAGQSASTSSLPAAMAIAATLVAVVVGGLFVATTMGLEVTASRRTLAVLSAVGVSRRSRTTLVVIETVAVAAVGGLVGVGVGFLGVAAVNAVARATIGVGPVARAPAALAVVGLATAAVIGVLAAPYPAWLARRSPAVPGRVDR
jgi:putative ABC transport system permease protein